MMIVALVPVDTVGGEMGVVGDQDSTTDVVGVVVVQEMVEVGVATIQG